jgi:hypothetical protein
MHRLLLPLLLLAATSAHAARLTVVLTDGDEIEFVGAIQRWDNDGNPRKPVNTKAELPKPEVDAQAARQSDGRWVFADLKPGRYDLVLIAKDRLRIEGFCYAPVLEFDPFFPGDATCDDETREFIEADIAKSEHFENHVQPLYMGGPPGEKKTVRVLVQLIRDKPTSYTPGAGTVRHEIWQYTWNYGAWAKERRTRVLDRILLPVTELRQWTWLWDPKLGGIEIQKKPVSLQYEVPARDAGKLRGLGGESRG